jgi:hypothetical protein
VTMEPSERSPLALDGTSPSVQTHLGIIQNVVQRMAANSASCKTWCITVVAAILVVTAEKEKPGFGWLAIFPTVLFASLDVYYLALEKGFRNSYNVFIQKLHSRTLVVEDLYSLAPTGSTVRLQLEALKSFSVWGFYLPLIVLAAAAVSLSAK